MGRMSLYGHKCLDDVDIMIGIQLSGGCHYYRGAIMGKM